MVRWGGWEKSEHNRLHRESAGGCGSAIFSLLLVVTVLWLGIALVTTARLSIDCRFYALETGVEYRHDGGVSNLWLSHDCEIQQDDGSWIPLYKLLRDESR